MWQRVFFLSYLYLGFDPYFITWFFTSLNTIGSVCGWEAGKRILLSAPTSIIYPGLSVCACVCVSHFSLATAYPAHFKLDSSIFWSLSKCRANFKVILISSYNNMGKFCFLLQFQSTYVKHSGKNTL